MEMVGQKKKGMLISFKSVANTLLKKREVEKLSEEDMLRNNLDEALELLDQAQTNFDNADESFIEIANEELTLAHNRVNLIIKKLKKIGNN